VIDICGVGFLERWSGGAVSSVDMAPACLSVHAWRAHLSGASLSGHTLSVTVDDFMTSQLRCLF